MYLSAEQRGYGGGREALVFLHCFFQFSHDFSGSPTKAPCPIPSLWRGSNKRRTTLNIAGQCLPLWSQVERGRCLMVVDPHVRAVAGVWIINVGHESKQNGKCICCSGNWSPPPPSVVDLPFWIFWAERGVWSAGCENPSKVPWIQKQCQYFWVWTANSNIYAQLVFALLYPSLNRPREVYIKNKILYISVPYNKTDTILAA